MFFKLAPVIVVSFLVTQYAHDSWLNKKTMPDRASITANQDAQFFIKYRDTAINYATINPAFVGSIPVSVFTAAGVVIPPNLSSYVGNEIKKDATGKRTIISYAKLNDKTTASLMRITDSDASIGSVQAGSWTSLADFAIKTPYPLQTTVTIPNGYVAAVVSIGS